ncbi:putative disease resistance protein RGA3 [Silene latifolia]|uniref:putative disease resistance protein RGA3 n=1 Tax=Silene latifolia TaxID=37657 RepID=UPI003D785639
MAESILFNIVERVLVSLGQHAFQEVVSSWGAQRDLEKLEGTIRFIRARVHDAEKRHEQESIEVIKEWIGRLRQVLYRADDLCDEVYTINCSEQRADRAKLAHKVRFAFSCSYPFGFNRKIAQEIKSIREELDGLKSEMDGLNLRVCLADQGPISRLVVERETISFVQADSVIGRDSDKNNILDMLFDPKYVEDSVTVIPIVGFGGLGKTTLAQLVFNDERVKKHFDVAKWACVPEINDHNEVLGKILSALIDRGCQGLSREQIQSQIRAAVKEKKFLLVLDDVWDESRDRWLDLLSLLRCGNRGSKIIVTTRSGVVATIVGTVPEAYKLGLLTQEESWNLFKILALKNGQEESNPTLAQIGKEIVRNCGNVPLAIRVVGSLLYSKHTEKEWELFRDAQLSKAKLIDLNNIMPVLKLSYDYLPSALKRCFAYCSLFPKDYEFENSELVRLWMAQGYVEPFEESLGMEAVGDQYFLELLRRNFFQDVKEYDTADVIRCKMHDLVHDLAQHVAGEECIAVDGSKAQFTNRLVHVNFCAGEKLTKAPRSLLAARNLRSLLFKRYNITASAFEELVFRLRSLRALDSRNIETVPGSIGRLRHLRYLNFSQSPIKFLPGGITRLDNLITLNVDHCRDLKELPRGFTELVNLRHLGIRECPFTDLPPNFGRMKSLRELNRFIIGQNNGLDTLGDLNLRGRLGIECRIWRTNAVIEAQAANLKLKKQLTSVSFCFKYQGDQPAVATQDEELLLESLHLPPSLKDLHFSGLRGNGFPCRMLSEMRKLVKIYIQRCDHCQALPIFSRLPLLKYLSFEGLKALEYVDVDDVRVSNEAYFPALESLTLNFMGELKSWSKLDQADSLQLEQCYVFPRLTGLQIFCCRKLMTLPFMPQLESLIVWNIHGELLKSILTSPSSSSSTPKLRYLHIESIEPKLSLNLRYQYVIKELVLKDCGSLKNISDGIQCLSTLEELRIYNCEDLDSWDETDGVSAWEGLKSLQTLQLSDISKLELLPHGIGWLSTLKHLSITGLPNLTELTQQINGLSQLKSLAIVCCPILTSLPASLHGLTSLQELTIIDCPKLISLSESLRGVTSLQKLKIIDCPDLQKRCQQPDGQDWPLIQHIPTVSFQLYP